MTKENNLEILVQGEVELDGSRKFTRLVGGLVRTSQCLQFGRQVSC